MAAEMPRWIVFRVEHDRDRPLHPPGWAYRPIKRPRDSGAPPTHTEEIAWPAEDAGRAFAAAVLENPNVRPGGEYLIVPLDGSGRITLDMQVNLIEQDGRPTEEATRA